MYMIKTTAVDFDQKRSLNSRHIAFLLFEMAILVMLAGCRFSRSVTPGVPTNPPVSETAVQPNLVQGTKLPTDAFFTLTPLLPEVTTPSGTLEQTTQVPISGTPGASTTPTSETQGEIATTAAPANSPAVNSTSPVATSTPESFYEIPEPVMGVETHSMRPFDLTGFQAAGIQWTRRNAFFWSDVEPVEGQRNWDAVTSIEQDLAKASKQGINTILIVRSTPLWAQKVYGHSCGAIKADKFQAFASFMRDLVARYSVPPYNVKYWELGNEPDVDPSLVAADSLFGCWGDQNDPAYGGSYYAQMLKVVYPAIKAADPQAQVLNGGLLLDCDPTHPPQGKDCKPALFFKGILAGGGANYFDIVSFHGYPQYSGTWNTAENTGPWQPRGGTVLGKLSYLREIMNEYGVDKPIFLTEGSLTCAESNIKYCSPPGNKFFNDQAYYAVLLYLRNWAAGIAGTIWYDFEGPGWRYGSMLDGNQKPKPDYNAFMFLLKELKGAEYHKEIIDYENVQVYEFSLPEKRVWVLWSKDDKSHVIIPPGDALQAFDTFGNVIAPANNGITFTSPIYMELKP